MGSFLQALTGLALLVVSCLPAVAEAPYSASFGRGVLHVGDSASPHVFQIEIAETAASRAQGLMYREEMAEDAGMLFIYPTARIASFWMKNTQIPLDMLFIKVSGEIVQIARDAVPGSLASIRSNAPVRAVLELNAGVADRLGIQVGDMVRLFRQPAPVPTVE